jgi:hypothetical protein
VTRISEVLGPEPALVLGLGLFTFSRDGDDGRQEDAIVPDDGRRESKARIIELPHDVVLSVPL